MFYFHYYYRMPITKTDKITRTFFLGLIRLHLLHHASIKPIFGLDMIRELERHGYSLSPGTLYPILHGLEQEGFLEAQKQVVAGKIRKYYQTTKSGKAILTKAMSQMQELINELNEA